MYASVWEWSCHDEDWLIKYAAISTNEPMMNQLTTQSKLHDSNMLISKDRISIVFVSVLTKSKDLGPEIIPNVKYEDPLIKQSINHLSIP